MTSNYVMVSIKLFHDVGNDQFIFLCNFREAKITSDGIKQEIRFTDV